MTLFGRFSGVPRGEIDDPTCRGCNDILERLCAVLEGLDSQGGATLKRARSTTFDLGFRDAIKVEIVEIRPDLIRRIGQFGSLTVTVYPASRKAKRHLRPDG